MENAVTGIEVTENAAPVITDSIIRNCSSIGIDASYAGAGTEISRNYLYGNEVPVWISGKFSFNNTVERMNVFHNPDDTSVRNTHNGIYVWDRVSAAASWSETEVPYVWIEGTEEVTDTGVLTLPDDTVLKFKPDATLYLNTSASIPNLANVTLTACSDDNSLGCTDALDNQPNDDLYWYGIVIESPDPSTQLDSSTNSNILFATSMERRP